ncbi:MAG: FecR domain-containing protein [Candidatus Malihini olakiniferum]
MRGQGPKAYPQRKTQAVAPWRTKSLGGTQLNQYRVIARSRTALWQSYRADYATRVGEQRHVTLADGTQLLLNTESAVNVNYDGNVLDVQLVRGEVMIKESMPEPRKKRMCRCPLLRQYRC